MASLLQRESARAARVRLAGTVLLLARLENGRQFRGKLHLLSVTGGLVHLENPIDEGIQVELLFHVGDSTVRTFARMLFPMWATQGCLQPFEFRDLAEHERSRLESCLEALLANSVASVFPPERRITEIFSSAPPAN